MTTAILTMDNLHEITNLPTAYTEDLNKFYRFGCPKKRDSILKQLKEKTLSKRINFNQLFPSKTKLKDVLNHVLLGVSVSGTYAIESKKLAKNVGCHVRTVNEAVKNIKVTGEIIVTGLADGCNKYVFVLKSHENFPRILKEVFYMDIAEPIAEDIAEPEHAENVDLTGLNDEKTGVQSLQSFQSFSSKQERDIYIANADKNGIFEEIEKEANLIENAIQEKQYVSTYFVSEFQHEVYRFIKDGNLHPDIMDNAPIIGLRTGSNAGHSEAHKGIQALIKINTFLNQGGQVRETVPALYSAMLEKGLTMEEYAREYNAQKQREALEAQKKQRQQQESKPAVKKVPFYNWIIERE